MELPEESVVMKISSAFDGGNIEVVSADNPHDIQLRIRHDHNSEFYQWFYFRLQGRVGVAHTLRLLNAGGSSYPEGWEEYRAVASYDREHWFRVDSTYDGEELTIDHVLEQSTVYFAYFVPYSFEQHQDLIQEAQESPLCTVEDLGETLDGRDLSVLHIAAPEAPGPKKTFWMTARQHPGETMAEWFVEGFLERLLDPEDTTARAVLRHVEFYVVPNMNPDGSVRGHLRTNAAGVNLNREWQSPSLEKSPEVYRTIEKMEATGVDFFLDVHGDESIPYVFLMSTQGVPSFDDERQALDQAFRKALLQATPDYQTKHGYPLPEPGKANLTMASNWVGERFKCLANTLEMPFKDNNDWPDELYGWSEVRSMQLGRDALSAMRAILPAMIEQGR